MPPVLLFEEQHFQSLPSKPTINPRADPDAVFFGGDMHRAKLLCKTTGCSFYAKPILENYCDDCYEKSVQPGLGRFQLCQNTACSNLVAGNVPRLCETCLMASK